MSVPRLHQKFATQRMPAATGRQHEKMRVVVRRKLQRHESITARLLGKHIERMSSLADISLTISTPSPATDGRSKKQLYTVSESTVGSRINEGYKRIR